MCSGPCDNNIAIVESTPHLYFYPVFSRFIDDMSHPFYELKSSISEFLVSLCEGHRPDMLAK
jgi:hypothetical protein